MKQILQNLANGESEIIEAPVPVVKAGHLLINTIKTLISVGTERMLVEFGNASLINKARLQPEKVSMVINKAKTDGILTAVEAVRSKLEQPITLGYCNVGTVHHVGQNVEGFSPGDRVVSNGAHADVVCVPKLLVAKVPDNVSDEEAVFTVAASIGLQGVRLAKPTLGECFVVIGVGLIGLLTLQLLLAQGCRVLAMDFDSEKLQLARQFGAETFLLSDKSSPESAALTFSRGLGVDGVIITASTRSSDPVSQAASISRKRGRIILVGVTGLELNRSDFYEKELTFQVSCSYGPGRYDDKYEKEGIDYPLPYVRWTEQRNFAAVLDLMSSGHLNVKPLISHRLLFEDAPKAYQLIRQEKSVLGIILEYDSEIESRHKLKIPVKPTPTYVAKEPVIALLGAGNYASRVLIPALKKSGANLHSIVTESGVTGAFNAKKWGFVESCSQVDSVIEEKANNTLVIATRHNTHAQFVIDGLKQGKNVFVEKPLAISSGELVEIKKAYESRVNSAEQPILMVGFNRRFAPHISKIKSLLAPIRSPKHFIYTVNAGAIPKSHWVQDPKIGGGRIIGEACHFIDLIKFLCGYPIISYEVAGVTNVVENNPCVDNATITLSFEDGSVGSIHYLSTGGNLYPKERLEVFVSGAVLQLNNFVKLRGYNWRGFSKLNLWQQDKGHNACICSFIDAVKLGRPSPIAFEELYEVSSVAISIAQKLSKGC